MSSTTPPRWRSGGPAVVRAVGLRAVASRAVVLSAAVWTAGLLPAGCGTPIPEGSVVLQQARLAELERRGAEVIRCRERLGQAGTAHHNTRVALERAQQRVSLLERRLGIGKFTPTTLQAAGSDWQLTLPKVQQLAAHGENPTRVALGALLKGHRAVVITYWATWCKPCTSPEELDHLKVLQRQLARYGATLQSIAVDSYDKVTSDARAPTWHYPLLQRDNAHLETLPRALVQSTGVGLPLFVVVDATGRVLWLRKGKLDGAVVAELVTAAARVNR